MQNVEKNKTDSTDLHRKKRISRFKKIICISLVILLILPTLLCIIMFQKLAHLQKQVNILMENTYGTTYSEGKDKIQAQISKNNPSNKKASVDSRLFFEEKLYLKAEEYATSLEEFKGNEYNIEESTKKEIVEQAGQKEKKDKNLDKLTSSDAKKDKTNISSNLGRGKIDKNVDSKLSGKNVYLTFDDGPSRYTDEILDTLNEFNVKATFFVIGKTDEESKRLYLRIVNEGHTLGMHSFSHDYKQIYNSLEDFDKDFTKLRDLLYDTTGYYPNIFRFPGGSGNTVSREDVSVFIDYLNKKSVTYYDWNITNGDATGKVLTEKESYDNVINGVRSHNQSIVLMHDTNKKESTVKSLAAILKNLTENNAKLLPINDDVVPIKQVSNGSNELNK